MKFFKRLSPSEYFLVSQDEVEKNSETGSTSSQDQPPRYFKRIAAVTFLSITNIVTLVLLVFSWTKNRNGNFGSFAAGYATDFGNHPRLYLLVQSLTIYTYLQGLREPT